LHAIIAAGLSLGFLHSNLHNYSGKTSSSLTRKTRYTRKQTNKKHHQKKGKKEEFDLFSQQTAAFLYILKEKNERMSHDHWLC